MKLNNTFKRRISNLYADASQKYSKINIFNLNTIRTFVSNAKNNGLKVQEKIEKAKKHDLSLDGFWFVDYYKWENKSRLIKDLKCFSKLSSRYSNVFERMQANINASEDSLLRNFQSTFITFQPSSESNLALNDTVVLDPHLSEDFEYVTVQLDTSIKSIYLLSFCVVFSSKVNKKLQNVILENQPDLQSFHPLAMFCKNKTTPSSIPAETYKKQCVSEYIDSLKKKTFDYLKKRFDSELLTSNKYNKRKSFFPLVEIFSMDSCPKVENWPKLKTLRSSFWRALNFYWIKSDLMSQKEKEGPFFLSYYGYQGNRNDHLYRLVVDEKFINAVDNQGHRFYCIDAYMEILSPYLFFDYYFGDLLSTLARIKGEASKKIYRNRDVELYSFQKRLNHIEHDFDKIYLDYKNFKEKEKKQKSNLLIDFTEHLDINIAGVQTHLKWVNESFQKNVVGKSLEKSYLLALKANRQNTLNIVLVVLTLILMMISFRNSRSAEIKYKDISNQIIAIIKKQEKHVEKIRNGLENNNARYELLLKEIAENIKKINLDREKIKGEDLKRET